MMGLEWRNFNTADNMKNTINRSTSGDSTVDTVGKNWTTDWNLLKTILNASYSTFFRMSSAKTDTWKIQQIA